LSSISFCLGKPVVQRGARRDSRGRVRQCGIDHCELGDAGGKRSRVTTLTDGLRTGRKRPYRTRDAAAYEVRERGRNAQGQHAGAGEHEQRSLERSFQNVHRNIGSDEPAGQIGAEVACQKAAPCRALGVEAARLSGRHGDVSRPTRLATDLTMSCRMGDVCSLPVADADDPVAGRTIDDGGVETRRRNGDGEEIVGLFQRQWRERNRDARLT
jgi:hypothetical protein